MDHSHHHHHHKPHQRVDPEGLTLDPHGEHEEHHGHIIVSFWTLTAVLTVLLVFTVMTVAFSRGEMWAAETFKVDIPQWVNISIALSIAVIKGTLVLMFFMQLKYDNKVNAVIFSACLFCVALFLGFSMIDLGSRGTIYSFKVDQIKHGGSGVKVEKAEIDPVTGDYQRDKDGKIVRVELPGPIVAFAADRYIAAHGLDAWKERGEFLRHHGHVEHEPDAISDRNHFVSKRGELTPGLFDEHAPAEAGEHGGHGEH